MSTYFTDSEVAQFSGIHALPISSPLQAPPPAATTGTPHSQRSRELQQPASGHATPERKNLNVRGAVIRGSEEKGFAFVSGKRYMAESDRDEPQATSTPRDLQKVALGQQAQRRKERDLQYQSLNQNQAQAGNSARNTTASGARHNSGRSYPRAARLHPLHLLRRRGSRSRYRAARSPRG